MAKDVFGNKVTLRKEEDKLLSKILRYDWIFCHWYEKLIIAILFWWSIIALFIIF